LNEKQERTRRMREQKWLFDKIIEANGPDYFWPMCDELLATVGLDLYIDIKNMRSRIKKTSDISKELAALAAKREEIARKAEDQGLLITARDNYFSAAACYAHAQGPIHEDDNTDNIYFDSKKIECYEKFIKYAPRQIRRVEIPFENRSLPGYFHLPQGNYQKVPCLICLGGMDNFKEMLVMVYGDKFLERGMAILAIDGPGQNEAALRKIRCTSNNFIKAGQAAFDFLQKQPEIDADQIAVVGISMGSFWALQIASYEHRLKAAVGYFVCHESGMNTIFNVACPVFKDKFMWMSGYEDEDEFDKFAQTLTLTGVVSKIQCPVLILAGEDDELSPIKNSYRVYDEITSPKSIMVYQGEHHGVSRLNDVRTKIADWLLDRFAGEPLKSESIYVDISGKETRK
jgi:dienelactone hydrolase